MEEQDLLLKNVQALFTGLEMLNKNPDQTMTPLNVILALLQSLDLLGNMISSLAVTSAQRDQLAKITVILNNVMKCILSKKPGTIRPVNAIAKSSDASAVRTNTESMPLSDNELKEFLCTPNSPGFANLCGMEEFLKQISVMFILPLHQPQLFPRDAYNRLLLYGPPGCGKTHLVHALSSELHAKLYCLMPSNIMSSYVGATEKLIRSLFQTLRLRSEVSILFIDELDAFCRVRNDDEMEHTRRVKIEFMQQLTMECEGQSRLLIVAATNTPWDIDSAVVRRFQLKLHLDLPNAEQRSELLKFYLGDAMHTLDNAALWSYILDKTKGYSNSDLKEIVRFALHQPIKELLDTKSWTMKDGSYTPDTQFDQTKLLCSVYDLPPGSVKSRRVELCDLITATGFVPPTVSKQDIAKYHAYANK